MVRFHGRCLDLLQAEAIQPRQKLIYHSTYIIILRYPVVETIIDKLNKSAFHHVFNFITKKEFRYKFYRNLEIE